jgi:hypothetical protein
MFGVMAANNLGFGAALAGIFQTFGQLHSHRDMTCPKSATQSLLDTATPLIGPIWRKLKVQQCHVWCAGCQQPWFWRCSGCDLSCLSQSDDNNVEYKINEVDSNEKL